MIDILPSMGLFEGTRANRAAKKKVVIQKLKDFFSRFFDISGEVFFGLDSE